MTPEGEKLDRLLAKAIVETKSAPRITTRMSKFSEIAEGIAKRRRAWDERADHLLAAMAKLDPQADAAFAKHEAALTAAEAGFKEMEDAVRDLSGGNNPPVDSAGSAGSSDKTGG